MLSDRTLPCFCLGAILIVTGFSAYQPTDGPAPGRVTVAPACPDGLQHHPRPGPHRNSPELTLARWSGALLHDDPERVALEEEKILSDQAEHRRLLADMAAEDPQERVRAAARALLKRFTDTVSSKDAGSDPGEDHPGTRHEPGKK